MNRARALSRVFAAIAVLALTACAQQGGTRGDAASAGTMVPPVETVAQTTPAQDATGTNPATPAPVVANAAAQTPPSASASGNNSNAQTDGEAAYQALYGDTSSAPSSAQPWDPWEKYNRKVHALNNAVDHAMIHPVALTYAHVVPRPARIGVSNFFRNLTGPANVVNALLQGKPSQAGGSLFRFLVNSTFGVAGILDVATAIHIPDRNEDLGQTLAVWGWKRSRYLELPVFGPRTVRDAIGMVGDMPINPLRNSQSVAGQVVLRTINVIDIRAQLLSTDALREGAIDDYRLFRDAWWQRRNYQISGENSSDSAPLPDYLQTEPTSAKPN